MSSSTVNQQNQQRHYSPQPPPLRSKFSPIHRDSRLLSFFEYITNFHNNDPLYVETKRENTNLTPRRTILNRMCLLSTILHIKLLKTSEITSYSLFFKL